MKNQVRCLCGCFLAASLLLFGVACGAQTTIETSAHPESEPTTRYSPPPFEASVYRAEAAQRYGAAEEFGIDISGTAEGYVAVQADGGGKLKFQVLLGQDTYNYDLPSDGTPTVYPLQCGNGTYTLRILENTSGSKYAVVAETTADVTLESEFAPFLRPNQMVNYEEGSACVAKAASLIENAASDAEAMQRIYDYIREGIAYDTEKAATVEDGYLPNPDSTLAEGKGICFDYAALAAAMLRSQGIPTKLITGYVSPGDLYHSWNMVYLKDTGWVTVGFEAPADEWSRIDLTFAAGENEFSGDGTSYTDRFTY